MTFSGSFLAHGDSNSGNVTVIFLGNLHGAPALTLEPPHASRPATVISIGSGLIGCSDPTPLSSGADPPVGGADEHEALLCVASVEAVVLWRLAECYAAAADGTMPPQPLTLMSRQGQVDAMAFGRAAQMLVVCCGNDVIVFDLKTLNNIFRCDAIHAI